MCRFLGLGLEGLSFYQTLTRTKSHARASTIIKKLNLVYLKIIILKTISAYDSSGDDHTLITKLMSSIVTIHYYFILMN